MKIWKKTTLALLVVFILLQFIPVDRSTPEIVASQDFITATQAPPAIATMLKTACYDCHSYETKYPWYASIAPASWWLQDHISEGREHLNFSTWASNPEKGEMMEEAAEEVSEGEMPLNSYTWMHADARLSRTQQQQLVSWFQQNGGGEMKNNNGHKKDDDDDDDDD